MIKELRNYDSEKIKSMIVQLKGQLIEYRFKLATAELKNTSILRETKRLIAKLFTILGERKEKLSNKDWKIYSDLISKNSSDIQIENLKKKVESKKEEKKSIKEVEIEEKVESTEAKKVQVKPKEKINLDADK